MARESPQVPGMWARFPSYSSTSRADASTIYPVGPPGTSFQRMIPEDGASSQAPEQVQDGKSVL